MGFIYILFKIFFLFNTYYFKNSFIHTFSVLNTDNMSIIGLTIDYGPYGFIDRYDPNHIFNGSDTSGRYTYKNQPDICEWNCRKLAEVLEPLIELNKSKEIIDKTFKDEFKKHYMNKMRKKVIFNLHIICIELV